MIDVQHSDIHILEAFDGLAQVFPADNQYVLVSYGDFGAPPVNFITRRGYKQDGETFLDYTYGRRTVSLEINFNVTDDTSRTAYWDVRAGLHNLLRHNRGGVMTYTLLRADGTKRALKVLPNPGMTLPASPDNWELREPVQFVAFNPTWFDPDTTDLTMSGAVGANLVFPIIFPILFGPSGVVFTSGSITYVGTYRSYPTFTLTGPYDWVNIENQATTVSIGLSVPIGANETRVITLEPGSLSIVDGSGANKFAELAPNSDLINFNIRPDPLVADGIQEITVQMQGGSAGVSGAQLSYNTRYLAI